MARAEGTMTLVIGLGALRRLSDPAAVVEDATGWTVALGVIAENGDELRAFLDRESVEPGFVSRERGVVNGLVTVRQRVTTDRHVFVGASAEHGAIAESVGWEYLSVEDAAGSAGWVLVDEGNGNGDTNGE